MAPGRPSASRSSAAAAPAGGGVAAVAAAGLRRFTSTSGAGASAARARRAATTNGRILEHGLHVWLGFYENAFRMIRDCYEEVGSARTGARTGVAESRLAHATLRRRVLSGAAHRRGRARMRAGTETVWSGLPAAGEGAAGRSDSTPETNPFTLASYLLRCVQPPEDADAQRHRPAGRGRSRAARGRRRGRALDEALDLDFSYRSDTFAGGARSSGLRSGVRERHADRRGGRCCRSVTILETILQDLNHSPQLAGSALNLLKAIAAQAASSCATSSRSTRTCAGRPRSSTS